MFGWLKATAGRVFKTKVGIALVGALVVGGGGTAMAMAGAQAPLISSFVAPGAAASPTAHTDDSSPASTAAGHDNNATEVAGQDDQDGNTTSCTGAMGATGAAASPTADSDDASPASTTAGQDDQDGSEHEGAGGDQNEAQCTGSVASVNVGGMSFVLSTAQGSVTVDVDGKTRFAGGLSGLSGLQVGAKVSVDGNHQANGTVLATQVAVHEAEPTHAPGSEDGSAATHTPGADGGSEATHTPQPTEGSGGD